MPFADPERRAAYNRSGARRAAAIERFGLEEFHRRQAAYSAAYRARHHEQVRERARARYHKNPEYYREWERAHRDEINARYREQYAANPEKFKVDPAITRRYNLWGKYKLTPEAFDALLLAQGGKCAICGEQAKLHVDHDRGCCPGPRSCGRCVNGLLCVRCNTGVGSFRDNADRLRAAAEYVERVRSKYHVDKP